MNPRDVAPRPPALGHRTWVVAGGRVPVASTGREPEFTSHDALSVLNAGDEEAAVDVWLYFEDDEPAGPYWLTVPARRMRRVRVNDLIDPFAPPLGVPYAAVVRASVPVVVQYERQDTRQAANAVASTMAFPVD